MANCDVPVIAIDGPSGSGKGTVARAVARHLRWHLLDSGALYRIVGLCALRRGIALDAGELLGRMTRDLRIAFVDIDVARTDVEVRVDDEDLTAAIRSEPCGEAASQVAQLPQVRAALHTLQHQQRRAPGLVADGRDMGTVIFPDAVLKVFLTASVEERAQRRYKQLIAKGLDASLPPLLRSLRDRDQRDQERAVSPLRPAADAIVIDSTTISAVVVMERVLELLATRGLAGRGASTSGTKESGFEKKRGTKKRRK